MRFQGVCLVTDDVCSLGEFYRSFLNADIEGDARFMEVKGEGASIVISSRAVMEEMSPGSGRTGAGSVVLEFVVGDVDAVFARLQSLGLPVVKPPHSYPWGTRSMWIRDPEENLLNFVQFVES